ncbi:ABC transporter ATP-binding protein [Paraburkholderia diazotrophica]|uniref:ABC transporter ATP-binding protein n=1 Tax=Paraburkholderia diazotrophica TaxID=667676 RepID=UPI00317E1687
MKDAIVEFRDVRKSYDGHTPVVAGLNLSIHRGEFLTLLGPSGSGKTTTLMMLAGFETPSSGSIFLDGVAITSVAPHKRNIGMVFQSYALFPHLSVADNVAYPLKVRRVPSAQVAERVGAALDMVKLKGLGDRLPAQLSGGQRQRVALARAIVFEPRIVLMDEPLGALDKQLREHMQYEIKQLHARLGITIVYVTHDQGEALTMSDRIAIFNEGIVQQLASPVALYEQPGNSFVASFIGENNQLCGRLSEIRSENWVVDSPGMGKLTATGVGTAAAIGDSLKLSIRPERIVLGAEADSLNNRFNCRVTDRTYQGDHIRVRLAREEGDGLIAKLANNRDCERVQIGDMVTVGFRSEDCIAFRSAP